MYKQDIRGEKKKREKEKGKDLEKRCDRQF